MSSGLVFTGCVWRIWIWLAALAPIYACGQEAPLRSIPAPITSSVTAQHQNAPATSFRLQHRESAVVGTVPRAVAVSGDHLFVADIHGLSVLRDESDALVLVARLPTTGLAQDIAVHGNRAYIADGASGIAVFDIRSPEAPRRLGYIELREEARALAISDGGMMSVSTARPALAVVDLRSREPDTLFSNIDIIALQGRPRTTVWVGDSLFVACWGHALLQFRATDLGLQHVWSDRTVSQVHALVAGEHRLYALAIQPKELVVLDAKPARARRIATLPLPHSPMDAVLAGDRLVVTCRRGRPAMVFDVTTPGSPTLIEQLPLRQDTGTDSLDVRVESATENRSRVIASTDAPSLLVIDIDAQQPIVAEHRGARVSTLRVADHAVLAAGEYPWLLKQALKLDLDGRDVHVPVRRFPRTGESLETTGWSSQGLRDVIPCGRELCTLRAHKTVCLARVGDDGQLIEQPCVELAERPSTIAFQPARATLWVGSLSGTIRRIVIRERKLALAGTTRTHLAGAMLNALAADEHGLVGMNGFHAVLYTYQDTDGPTEHVGQFLLQSPAVDLQLLDGFAFVPQWGFGLQIIDVSAPQSPIERVWLPMAEPPYAVSVARHGISPRTYLIAMARAEHGVALYHWSAEDAHATRLAYVDTPGMATDVALDGERLWVADTSAIIRFTVRAGDRS